jgi:hypothetical protein
MQIRQATVADVAEMHRVRMSVHENRLGDPAWIKAGQAKERGRAGRSRERMT